MIEHSYKTDPRITLGLWRSFYVIVQSMKDLGSVLQLRMFNNRLEKHFFVVLNNSVEGTISPTMHFPSFFVLADITNKLSKLHLCYRSCGRFLTTSVTYRVQSFQPQKKFMRVTCKHGCLIVVFLGVWEGTNENQVGKCIHV